MLCRMLALLIAITSKEWPAGFEYWHMCDSCVQRHGRLFPLPNTFLSPSWVPPCLVEAQRLGVLALFSHPTKRQKNTKKERKKNTGTYLWNCVQYTFPPFLLPFDLKAHYYSCYHHVGVVERKIALSLWWCYIKLTLFNCSVLALSKDKFLSLYYNAKHCWVLLAGKILPLLTWLFKLL